MKKLALLAAVAMLATSLPVMPVSASEADNACADVVMDATLLDEEPEEETLTAEEQVKAFAERMYTVVLNREADAEGIEDWTNWLLNRDVDGAGIANGFIMSDEFLAKDITNDEYVNILYRTFFDREADDAGRQTWTDLLAQGTAKGSVLAGFVNSDEFSQLCYEYGISRGEMDENGLALKPGVRGFVDRLYSKVLNRASEEAGALSWVNEITAGNYSAEDVAKMFFASDEYIARGLNNEQFVDTLYQTFMGRVADADGKNMWVGLLTGGSSQGEVLEGFSRSNEFATILREYGLGTAYFEVYNLPVQPELVDFKATGILYDSTTLGNGDENVAFKPTTWNTVIDSVTRTPAENGYELITVTYKASSYFEEYWDIYYNYIITFSNGFYDYHTGVQLRSRSTTGDDSYTSVTPITYNEKVYDISYTRQITWDHADWEYMESYDGGDDYYRKLTTATIVAEIKVPAGYDGLVLGIFPKTSYTTSNTTDIEETIEYAEPELTEGTVYYSINPALSE